jgi:hypothetical protein
MIANDKPPRGKVKVLGVVVVGLVLFGFSSFLVFAVWRSMDFHRTDPSERSTGLSNLSRKPTPKKSVEELRKEFPFTSLGDRLAYEASRVHPPPVLSPEAKKDLAEAEERLGRVLLQWLQGDEDLELTSAARELIEWRREALRELHSQTAEEFINREGAGFGRMRARPKTDALYLQTAPSFQPDNVSYPESLLEDDPQAVIPRTGAGGVGPARMLSLDSLKQMHVQGRTSFLTYSSFGYVLDHNRVSGFEPHQFRYKPGDYILNPLGDQGKRKVKERWAIYRLELVSVLKFDKPVVYLSPTLPRMQDLKAAAHRDLSVFEVGALKKLQEGEDLVAEATTNRIRMMGSLRAGKKCLECHHGERGELLGSFSYELLRDPPLLKP